MISLQNNNVRLNQSTRELVKWIQQGLGVCPSYNDVRAIYLYLSYLCSVTSLVWSVFIYTKKA